MEYLKSRWDQTMALVPYPELSESLFAEIVTAYSSKVRHYHTLEHLENCFRTLDAMFVEVPSPKVVELALWYHDVVYYPMDHDNEEQSAKLAYSKVRHLAGEDVAALVAGIIQDTDYTAGPESPEEAIVFDVDLAILGSAPNVYDKYEANIRKEYSNYSDEVFKEGRSSVLRRLLAKPSLYHTREFRGSVYKDMAPINIRRALIQLGSLIEISG